jgi:hypothetical protein
MERFWNLIHYFVYIGDYQIHLLFNKINPVFYFYMLPFAKKHFKKKGIDPLIEVNKSFKKQDLGISSIRSGGLMILTIILLCFGIGNLYIGIYRIRYNVSIYPFLLVLTISFAINYFLLFRNNKYLQYFKEFEKMERAKKNKWAWISFGVILSIFLFSIGSFAFMIHRLSN